MQTSRKRELKVPPQTPPKNFEHFFGGLKFIVCCSMVQRFLASHGMPTRNKGKGKYYTCNTTLF